MHIYRIRAWQGATLLLSTIALMADIQVIHFSSVRVDLPPTGHVSVINTMEAWVGLEHTTDGGMSWTAQVPAAATSREFVAAPGYSQNTFFVTAKRGWLSGAGATWATTDGGQAWQILQPGRIFAITFSGNAGWMALGDDRTVRNLRTEDLGRRWTTCGKQWEKFNIALT